MAELEISVLSRQCLARRLGEVKSLRRQVTCWERGRNRQRARVRWGFTVEAARDTLGRSYPQPHTEAASSQAAAA